MPRAGLAAGNADGGCAGRRLPQLRQRIYQPDGLAGLLFEPADQVRHPHRGDGHAAHVGRALYLSGGYGTYSVKPGRRAYQRVGSLGAPRERHRGRGHETAGHVLLQPAGGVPGLFRDARLETPRGHRVSGRNNPRNRASKPSGTRMPATTSSIRNTARTLPATTSACGSPTTCSRASRSRCAWAFRSCRPRTPA